MKKCTKCGEIKDLTCFHKASKNKDGLEFICKKCKSLYSKTQKSIEQRRTHYQDNKVSILEKQKEYRDKNDKEIKISKKTYYTKNKSKILSRALIYTLNNKEAIKKYQNDYQKTRRNQDPIFRLSSNTRTLIRNSFKRANLKINKGSKSSSYILGCTMEYFITYIQSLFTEGMTLNNHGSCIECWNIDHRVPVSLAETEEEVLKLNHYTNLQPMWSRENIKKSNKCI